MGKSRLFILSNNSNVANELQSAGFQTKECDGFGEIKIRAGILRSDAVVKVISFDALKMKEFYEAMKIVDSNIKGKPSINVICDETIDDLFDKVYSDDTLPDDIIVSADEFKNSISEFVLYPSAENIIN